MYTVESALIPLNVHLTNSTTTGRNEGALEGKRRAALYTQFPGDQGTQIDSGDGEEQGGYVTWFCSKHSK